MDQIVEQFRLPDDKAELPSIPGGWRQERIKVGPHQLELTLPVDPNLILDHSCSERSPRSAPDDPYWACLWPAAHTMARAVALHDWHRPARVLEIGSGLGLVGLAALTAGLNVTFSDSQPKALSVSLHNAHQNGFSAERVRLDWRHPLSTRFPIILGCDVVYDPVNHVPILHLLESMLQQGGQCWIGDPGRGQGGVFFDRALEWGFNATLVDESLCPLRNPLLGRFQMIVLRHTSETSGPLSARVMHDTL